ncbi:hypothetical protein [Pseudomonas putida]|nr:hypothetical protein [Pseudomonas putida]HDS0977679.1 hypothetical protein [Pseudomonas putida]
MNSSKSGTVNAVSQASPHQRDLQLALGTAMQSGDQRGQLVFGTNLS